jgi:hypothetical protein
MPKNRRSKTQRITKAEVDRRTREILNGQRQRFSEKFGRDWTTKNPVLFDSDTDSPTPMSRAPFACGSNRHQLRLSPHRIGCI